MLDAPTLTAIALIISAVGGIVSPVLLFINGRASKLRSEVQIAKIEKVEKLANGLSAKLAETAKKQGTAEGKAEGLEQGRNESKGNTP